MMEQTVRVKRVHDDGTATVVHVRQSACSGDCHKCSGCGAAAEQIQLEAVNEIGAQAGDVVKIESASAPVLKAAAVMYVVPMVLFFLGYLIGMVLWNLGALVGCLAFVIGIASAVYYDRRVLKKEKTLYTITAFAGDSLLKHTNKGDNEF